MKQSPAYSFIKERLDLEFEPLERDKVTPWAFFLTAKGVRLADFFGKEINYTGVEFEGSPREIFWNGFIQPFLKDIVSRNFAETKHFCQENGIDWKLPLEETAFLLKKGINKLYYRMSVIDQRLRGKGHPDAVAPYNPQKEVAFSEAFVDERMSAEVELQPQKKNRLEKFYEEHKFWCWFIGIIVAIMGTLIRIFG